MATGREDLEERGGRRNLSKKLVGAALCLLSIFFLGMWARPVSYYNAWMYVGDWLGGVQNHEVMVGGHRVHYETEGPANGPVVVLVHGLGGRAEDWRNLAPDLAKAGYRVYLPDLLGYGRSEKPKNFSYSVRDEAAVTVEFLDAVNLQQVDLGGWSMGGAIVQHVAADHPERVKRLMLFDAAGLWVLPRWNLALFTPLSTADLAELDDLLMPNPPKVPGFVARDILRVSADRSWIIHRALASMLTGQDATDKLVARLKMPVLLMWGKEDRIVPVSQGETLHAMLPQSELDVIPGCGHLAPDQCATQMAPKVIGFLKK
jgi:pimeloyl-ACP methyl ester carboxylesterase